jgi:hypothetical protein
VRFLLSSFCWYTNITLSAFYYPVQHGYELGSTHLLKFWVWTEPAN